ncbi:MAG: hypothetical protein GY940_30845 [bacterium]|nr:hypothetical protein [bacterium]
MKKSMNNKGLSRYYADLSKMVHSGLTIDKGLGLMKQGKTDALFRLLDLLQHHVGRGGTLWEGMSQYPQYFDRFQLMTVKAAEESGTIVETFEGLSRYYEMRHKEKQRLLVSLIYPFILLHAVVLLPPLKYLFSDNLGRSYWSVVLPVLLTAYGLVGVGVWFWKTFCRSGKIREVIDELILKLPVFGKLARGLSLVRVLRALSSLHNAGAGPVMAAGQAIQTAGNRAVTQRLKGAMPVLENGGTYTDFFSFAGVLEPTQLGMIEVGEETGMLDESLDRMVVMMEDSNHHRLTATIKAIGYIAYFICAAIAAFTIISFYSGYFGAV